MKPQCDAEKTQLQPMTPHNAKSVPKGPAWNLDGTLVIITALA